MSVYSCTQCDEKFPQEALLTNHYDGFHQEKTFKCSKCPMAFAMTVNLTRHEQAEHEEKKFECKLCGKCFAFKANLKRHNDSEHKTCDRCGKSDFSSQEEIRDHIINDHPNERSQCGMCHKYFPDKTAVAKHKFTDHNRVYKCEVCEKEFLHNSLLERHRRTVHMNAKDHLCEHCNTPFSTKQHMVRHIATVHYKVKNYHCDFCDKRFPSNYHKGRHERRVHPDEIGKESAKCEPCGMTFDNVWERKEHEQTQQHLDRCLKFTPRLPPIPKIRVIKCDYCEKVFEDEQQLADHEDNCEALSDGEIVSGEDHPDNQANYKCGRCGKDFPTRHKFKKHIRVIHQRTEECTCELCGKAFITIAHLNRHKEGVHNKVKNFVCKPCDQTFARLDNLKQHQRTHKHVDQCMKIGVDPNVAAIYVMHNIQKMQKKFQILKPSRLFCKLCRELFPSEHELRMHETTCEKVMFRCKKCGKGFGRKSHLQRHIDGVHKKKVVHDCTCEFCGRSFPSTYHLNRHITSVHEKVKNFGCKACNTTYARMEQLKQHFRSIMHQEAAMGRTNEECADVKKPDPMEEETQVFRCKICEEVFPNKNRQELHEATCVDVQSDEDFVMDDHEENYEYEFDVKDISLRLSGSDNEEMDDANDVDDGDHEYHMNIKPDVSAFFDDQPSSGKFMCTACSVSFQEVRLLRRHILADHDSLKQFECRTCHKKFGRQENVEKHEEFLHDQKRKTFQCNVCAKTFKSVADLSGHMKNEHEKRSFFELASSSQQLQVE